MEILLCKGNAFYVLLVFVNFLRSESHCLIFHGICNLPIRFRAPKVEFDLNIFVYDRKASLWR